MSSDDHPDRSDPRFFALEAPISPHLRARLQGLAAVTGRSVEDLLERWLEREIASLDEARREVVDRIASSSLKVAESRRE